MKQMPLLKIRLLAQFTRLIRLDNETKRVRENIILENIHKKHTHQPAIYTTRTTLCVIS